MKILSNLFIAAAVATSLAAVSHAAEPLDFAVYATESLELGHRAVVRGGAAGAFGTASGEGRVELHGGRVYGDLYGRTVTLGPGARAKEIHAETLVERGGSHQSLGPLPEGLPAIAPVPAALLGGDDLVVPEGETARLGPDDRRVEVGARGTLIIEGGEYHLESLTIAERGRTEVRAPSLLYVSGDVDIGARGYVGTRKGRRSVQATIIAAGDVQIGPRARVMAAFRAPAGTIVVNARARAKGSLFARRIEIRERARLKYVPWDPTPAQDPVCFRLECDAVAGGTIDCVHLPWPGQACDDGNACTQGDACDDAGYCVSGSPLPDPDPNDENPCLLDECNPTTGYLAPFGTVCDPNYPCHASLVCNGANTACGVPFGKYPIGTACDDGIPNNGLDACTSYGKCVGPLGPYDCKANNCGTPPDPGCWLDEHPAFKSQITWRIGGQELSYDQWPPAMQQELHQAFTDAWSWIQGGFQSFQGTPVPDPLPNAKVLADTDPATTEFTDAVARPMYLAKVAHSLALEASGHLPWSLCDYSTDMLSDLLYHFRTFGGGSTLNPNFTAKNAIVPAHPTVTYPFLAQNGLIGVSTGETINLLLDWGRRLRHHAYGSDALNMEYHWQYRGLPPVSRIISGTCNQYPWFGFAHWTRGCSGTTGFLKDVLQAVNIPVRPWGYCGHQQAIFPSEGLYLGHGDDPYSFFKQGDSVVPPLGAILIDEPTYQAWFTGPPAPGCPAVSRRQAQLAAQLLPDILVTYHCLDVFQSKSHAQSTVAEALAPAYTVAELEAQNLWQQLDQRVVALGLNPATGGCYLASSLPPCGP